MYSNSTVTALNFRKKIFWGLAVLVFTLLGFYVYFVSQSVVNVVLREEVEVEIARISADISELEFAYIEKKNSINRTLALSLGFSEANNQQFVSRKSALGGGLTLSE